MIKKWIFLAPLLMVSSISFANHYDISIAGGVAFSDLSHNSDVQINPSVLNQYKVDKTNTAAPLAKVGFGYTFEKIRQYPFNIGINLAGYYVGFNQIEGTEYPLANVGQFDTLDYQFNAESFVAMLESRFYFVRDQWRPFILLGIGESWNHLYGYEEVPTNPNSSAAAVPSGFDGHMRASFAYEAGIGVQYLFFKDKKYDIQWSLSLDYRYMNLGKGNLGTMPAETTGETLDVAHLNVQALVFTMEASI